jgi:hypothetical protein
MVSIIMMARGFDTLAGALIILKCSGGIIYWVSTTGRKDVDVDRLLDAARKRNDFRASGVKRRDGLILASPGNKDPVQ